VIHQGTFEEVLQQGIDLHSVVAEVEAEAGAGGEEGDAEGNAAKGRSGAGNTGEAKVGAGVEEKKAVQKGGAVEERKGATAEAGAGGKEEAEEGAAPKRSTSHHQQVAPEARQQGAVSKEIYLTYLRELQYPMLALIAVVGVASQGARNGNDWWLTRWASAADRHRIAFYLGVLSTLNPKP